MATVIESNDAFTAFWNDVLVAKFERFRNIMLGGLSYHSKVPLAKLALPAGAHAVDVGCGWGDTAIELARKVGPTGARRRSRLLQRLHGKGPARRRGGGAHERPVRRSRRADVPVRAGVRPLLFALRDDVLREPGRRDAQRAHARSSPAER